MARQQHYVPQFHLRQWAELPDRVRVACFDKGQQRRFVGSTRDVGGERFFYGKEEVAQIVERMMSQIEGYAAGIYKTITHNHKVGEIPEAPHKALAMYVATLDARTREKRAQAEQLREVLSEDLLKAMGITDWRLKWPVDLSRVEQMGSIVEAIQKHDRFERLSVTVVVNRTRLPFTTSDHPLVRHNDLPPRPEGGGRMGILSPGIQFHLPMDPWHCLVLYDHQTYGTLPDPIVIDDEGGIVHERWLQARDSFRHIFGLAEDGFQHEMRFIAAHPEISRKDRRRYTRGSGIDESEE